jgi:hypothetical protein
MSQLIALSEAGDKTALRCDSFGHLLVSGVMPGAPAASAQSTSANSDPMKVHVVNQPELAFPSQIHCFAGFEADGGAHWVAGNVSLDHTQLVAKRCCVHSLEFLNILDQPVVIKLYDCVVATRKKIGSVKRTSSKAQKEEAAFNSKIESLFGDAEHSVWSTLLRPNERTQYIFPAGVSWRHGLAAVSSAKNDADPELGAVFVSATATFMH